MTFEELVQWYQKKIGTYDKPQWEKHVELRALKGLENLPRKTARIRTELIDVDLVRGSTFVKPKPHYSFLESFSSGLCHGLFLPFYWKWWIKETSSVIFRILLAAYSLQMLSFFLYILLHLTSDYKFKIVTHTEAVIPVIMMLTLSILHSQIAVIQSSSCRTLDFRQNQNKKLSEKRKPSFSNMKATYNLVSSKKQYMALQRSHSNRNKPKQNVPLRSQSLDFSEFVSLHKSTGRSRLSESEKLSHSESRKSSSRMSLPNEFDFIETDGHKQKMGIDSFVRLNTRNIKTPPGEIKTLNKSSLEISTESSNCYHSTEICDRIIGNEWNTETINNSEECSYSSESSHELSDTEGNSSLDDPFSWEFYTGFIPVHLKRASNLYKVSCTIWENNEPKKVDLTALDISSSIMSKTGSNLKSADCFYFGFIISAIVASLPIFSHYLDSKQLDSKCFIDHLLMGKFDTVQIVLKEVLGYTYWERSFTLTCIFLRLFWSLSFFFLLSVAERTFKQKLQLAKLFSHLTSARKAKKSDIPHFRLNKVTNIKAWLSVRSCLKRHGPQHSVDLIVSTAVIMSVILLSLLCIGLLKDGDKDALQNVINVEIVVWLLGLGVYILRFMTIGTKINKKYRNLSTLITEQINLYLQMEQKPHKKDELLLANNVLKLAAELIKELESPFKISGLSANPYLYNITKLVLLSAFSGVLSDLLGFKLKLYKIKLK